MTDKYVPENVGLEVTTDWIMRELHRISIVTENIINDAGSGGTNDHNVLINRDIVDQHPIGAITGLQTALDGKSNVGHLHSEYADKIHQHVISDVTGLQSALDGKEPVLGNPSTNGYVLSSTTAGVRSWVAQPAIYWQAGVPADSIHYSAGFVGIGTDNPEQHLHVKGPTSRIQLEATSGQTNMQFNADSEGPSPYQWNIITNASEFRVRDGSAALNLMLISAASGNLTMTGNVTAFSDIRYKYKIEDIEIDLDDICALRTITYDDDQGIRRAGGSAQDIEKLIPEVVNHSGERLSMDYGKSAYILAIQTARHLKEENEHLRMAISNLEYRLSLLEGK